MQVDLNKIRTIKPYYEVIVKKYTKPEMHGSLYLPKSYREDKTGSLWEVVKSNEKADHSYGAELAPGDIIKTRWGHAGDLGVDTEDGCRLYLVKPEDIEFRWMNTWNG